MTLLAVWRHAALSLAALLLVLGVVPCASAQTDIPASVLTTAKLVKGATQASTIDRAGDADWFKLTLRDANAYAIAISGPAVIRIYDNAGVLKASSLSKKYYVWRTPVTGTYFISAQGTGTQTGPYTIRVTVQDPAANTATEGKLTVSKPSAGRMSNTGDPDGGTLQQDEDWYRIYLTPGTYHVMAELNASDDAGLFLYDLIPYDAAGQSLFGSVYNFNFVDVYDYASISFDIDITNAGSYFISVASGFVAGRADYNVSVTCTTCP
jgi:hypothetical protein